MRRFAALSVLASLVACAAPQKEARDGDTSSIATSLEMLPDGAVCQVGPNGGPVDPPKPAATTLPKAAEQRHADRGIGGTGAPPANTQLADRGIGGTGIVGVITGFASVCVDGLEVAYDSSAMVDIDGTAGTPSALRTGQIVVIRANGSTVTPLAQTISVRRQVSGRIESIELGTGTLTIAGQAISVPAGTWGADTMRLGDWVAVSGLRRTNGMLIASRLDPAPAGTMTVRGQVVREGDTARIGDLVLNGAAAVDLMAGQYVMVSGDYAGGRAQVRTVTQDPVFGDPTGYFATAVNHLVLQAFVRVANGMVYLNGMKVAAGPGISGKTGADGVAADGVAIVLLERKSDGSFTAVGLRYTEYGGSAPGANQAPTGTSRGPTTSPPIARRSAAQMMALTGNGSQSSAGPTVATTATTTEPVSTDPVIATTSTEPATIGPATTPTPSLTAAAPPPSATPPISVIISPPSEMTLPPTTPSPVGSGAKTESATPITSQLMSSLNGSNNAIKSASVTRKAAALHRASVGHSTASATVILATEALTTPTAQTAAGSVKTPAVLAPPSSKRSGIRPRNAGTDSAASNGH